MLMSFRTDPLLDAGEFASQYFAHIKGSVILSTERQLLAMALSVWAASFGVDEHGVDKLDGASSDPIERATRRKRTEEQVQELLRLVDIHSIMRHPTWDGVRVLMLIWPLTQSTQTPLQRAVRYHLLMNINDADNLVCRRCMTPHCRMSITSAVKGMTHMLVQIYWPRPRCFGTRTYTKARLTPSRAVDWFSVLKIWLYFKTLYRLLLHHRLPKPRFLRLLITFR